MEGRQDREDQLIADLVHLHPLGEDPSRCQLIRHPGVELGREEACRAADPGIRRLGDDQVVALVPEAQGGAGVVDEEVGAGIVEDPPVGRIEEPGRSCEARCRWW